VGPRERGDSGRRRRSCDSFGKTFRRLLPEGKALLVPGARNLMGRNNRLNEVFNISQKGRKNDLEQLDHSLGGGERRSSRLRQKGTPSGKNKGGGGTCVCNAIGEGGGKTAPLQKKERIKYTKRTTMRPKWCKKKKNSENLLRGKRMVVPLGKKLATSRTHKHRRGKGEAPPQRDNAVKGRWPALWTVAMHLKARQVERANGKSVKE